MHACISLSYLHMCMNKSIGKRQEDKNMMTS